MGFTVTAAALMLAGTAHVPVLRLGPSSVWAESVGPRYLSVADDGRSVRAVGPGDRDWTLDPATKKEVPAPVVAPDFRLVERTPGLIDLLDAKGGRVVTVFDPGFKPEDGTWGVSGDRRYLLTAHGNFASVWRVADGRRVLGKVSLNPSDFWAIRGDELLIPGWVNVSGDPRASRYSACFTRYSLTTGRELPKLLVPTDDSLHGWRTTPDGRHAVSLFGGRLFRVDLDATVALPTLTPPGLGADPNRWSRDRPAFAPSGQELAFGWGGGVVALDYPSGRVRWRTALPLPGSPRVGSLAYAPAGDRLYVTTSEPTALLTLDGATGHVLDRETFAPKPAGLAADAEPFVALAEFAAGGELVVVTRAGAVELRDLPGRATRATRLPSGLWVASRLTPDGGLLAVLTRSDDTTLSRRLHFLDLAAAGLRWTGTPEFASDADGFDVSPDGRFLSVAQTGLRGASFTAVYDLATGERRHLVPGPAPERQSLDPASGRYVPESHRWRPGVLTRDGRYELRYFEDTLYVEDVLSGGTVVSERADGFGKSAAVRSAAHLAAAPVKAATAIYDTRTRARLRTIEGRGSVSLSPDGRYLAVHDEGRVTVWDLADLPRPQPPARFPAAQRQAAWEEVDRPFNGDKLPESLWFLQHDPRTVPTLTKRVKPVPLTPPGDVARWLADLGAADAAVRAVAYGHLLAQGSAARERLTPVAAGQGEQATLALNLLGATEKPNDAEFRAARAVELLERIASPAATDLLTRYAAGDPAARLTVEARAALARLK